MNHYEERTETCDLCKNKIPNQIFRVDEVTICHKTGESYPEGGSGIIYEIDLCPDCFHLVIATALKDHGITLTETKWEY